MCYRIIKMLTEFLKVRKIKVDSLTCRMDLQGSISVSRQGIQKRHFFATVERGKSNLNL